MVSRQTKIIATLGPSSASKDIVTRLVREGVDCFRINFAHGNPEVWSNMISIVRDVECVLDKPIPVIGDLQGPTVRTGILDSSYNVKKGDKVFIVLSDTGSASRFEIPLPNKKVFNIIEEGDVIALSAGAVWLRVDDVKEDSIVCIVLNDSTIKSEMTFTILNKDLPLPTITEKDIRDLNFAIESGIDYVGLSFVRSREDIRIVRDYLQDKKASDVKIIAKIETKKAVENLDSIIYDTDAVLVARGDLAMYFPLEKIPEIQLEIIRKSLYHAKPVIVATQLLESMVEKPLPTRSEVVDIMVAVKEGVDALMLADETAIGKYPVEAVRWLRKIIEEAERRLSIEIEYPRGNVHDRFAHSVAHVANLLNAKILIFTRGGTTARRVSRFRPKTNIYAATHSERVRRQLQLIWGIKPCLIKDFEDVWDALNKLLELLKREEEISIGDIIVMTGGLREGTTNLMKVIIID